MNKKIVGVLVAVVLAAVGTVALVTFVQNAEQRAQAGEELVEVYVVNETIPAGTMAEDLTDLVDIELVPAKVQAAQSVQNLQGLSGQVAAVDLVAGEQLVSTRFIEPASFASRDAGVIIPAGKLEVTIRLEPERAIGGLLEPGDTVAVLSSFEAVEVSSANVIEIDGQQVAIPDSLTQDSEAPDATKLLLRKVLVTAVQETPDRGVGGGDDEASRLEEAPFAELYVTLAVDPEDAERLVFTSEFGAIYLAQERPEVPELDTEPKTRENIFDTPESLVASK